MLSDGHQVNDPRGGLFVHAAGPFVQFRGRSVTLHCTKECRPCVEPIKKLRVDGSNPAPLHWNVRHVDSRLNETKDPTAFLPWGKLNQVKPDLEPVNDFVSRGLEQPKPLLF
jgi:hypothetical protein